MLADEELFCAFDLPGCPVSPADSAELRRATGTAWSVFVTVARVAADAALPDDEVVKRVAELAGFERLKGVLRRHFLERGELLRSHRIARDAYRLVETIRFDHLPRAHRDAPAAPERLERFLRFVQSADGDPAVAGELTAFLREKLSHTTGRPIWRSCGRSSTRCCPG